MIKDLDALIKKSTQCGVVLLMGGLLWYSAIHSEHATIPAVSETEIAVAQTEKSTLLETEFIETEVSNETDKYTLVGPISSDKYKEIMDDKYTLAELVPRYLDVQIELPMTWEEFEADLNSKVNAYSGTWSLYLKDLTTDQVISINDRPQEAASLIKLYIMGAVYDSIEKGELEESGTINNLLDEMITVSDNEASNELARHLSPNHNHKEGMAVVNEFIRANGFTNTIQVNGLEDSSLWYGSGQVNQTSTKDCATFMEKIYDGEMVSHLASLKMENLLLDQEVTYKIPSELAEYRQLTIANKTGEVADTENDSAIIYTNKGDYILCIMSTDLSDTGTAVDRIHALTSVVYKYFNQNGEEYK